MTRPFVDMCCGECGIEFKVPEHFYSERKETGKGWFCPNGHSRVFRESDVHVLTRERDRLKQQMAQKDDELSAERNRRILAERDAQRIADKAQRAAKRTLAATCPCCNRSFANLARHLKTQHQIVNGKPLTVVAGGKK